MVGNLNKYVSEDCSDKSIKTVFLSIYSLGLLK